MSPESTHMISVEAVAGGLVMVVLAVIYLGWEVYKVNSRVSRGVAHVKGELDAMRMTLAALERV